MSSRTVLSQDPLERCAQRAGGDDRENRFFMEDFEEPRRATICLRQYHRNSAGLD
jgi:hypothetical protein